MNKTIKYCTGHYKLEVAKQMAQELREGKNYASVRLGNYSSERIFDEKRGMYTQKYCQIYVEPLDSY